MEYPIEKWRAGDVRAFEDLFQQYRRLVCRNAYLFTGDWQESEDILQEVFTATWEARRSFDPEKGKFITWLHKITINKCISRYRKKRMAWLSFDETDFNLARLNQQESLEEALERKHKYEKLLKALDQLDEKHRTVIILRYINDLPYSEIAEVLDIPVGTVKSRIHNAVRLLVLDADRWEC